MSGEQAEVDSGQYADLDARIAADEARIGELETRAVVDQELIAELQADGVLGREHAAQLEEALRTSRRIGAAIGMVMAHHKVSEAEAFEILRQTSMDTNRKVRVLADEVVLTGDVSVLPTD